MRGGDWHRRFAGCWGRARSCPGDPEGFRLTREQLGVMANLSRHPVGRKLASFEASGWIACGQSRVRLPDAEGLAAFACGDDQA